MERMEIELRMELQAAIRLIQQLVSRVDELELKFKQAGQAADQIGVKTQTAGQKAGAAFGGASPGVEKFNRELQTLRDRAEAAKAKIDQKRQSLDAVNNSLGTGVASVGRFIQAWVGLDLIRRGLEAIDERLRGIVESALKLSGQQVQQAAMAKPVMEAFGLFNQGRAGEQRAIGMVNDFSARTGMSGVAASTFLSSMASSIGNDPRRISELHRIASLGQRSGMQDRDAFDMLKSIFTGDSGQVVSQSEIDRRAAAVQYGLLTSGKSDPKGFLSGLGKVISQRTSAGGSWDAAFTDYLTLTSIIPAGQQSAQQAQMAMRALLGEEPEAREKLTAIYAKAGTLPGYAAATKGEVEEYFLYGTDEKSQQLQKNLNAIDNEQREMAIADQRHRARRRRTPADEADFQLDQDRRRRNIENLKLDMAQRTQAHTEQINAQRRAAAFAALGPDERMRIGLEAAAAASGDPALMDEFNLALGGQQMRAEAVRRLASPQGVNMRAKHAAELASGNWLSMLQLSEMGMMQTTEIRRNIADAYARKTAAQGTTFGQQLYGEFDAGIESAYDVFRTQDKQYTNGTVMVEDLFVRSQADVDTGMSDRSFGGGSQNFITKEGAKNAFRSRQLIRTLKSYEMDYRRAGDHQTADKIRQLGLKYENLLFYNDETGPWTNAAITATIQQAFEELGPIIEGQMSRGTAAPATGTNRMTGDPLPPFISAPESEPPATQPAGEGGPIGMRGGFNYQLNVGQLFVAPGGLQQLPGRLENI